jgi:hypothetical protein
MRFQSSRIWRSDPLWTAKWQDPQNLELSVGAGQHVGPHRRRAAERLASLLVVRFEEQLTQRWCFELGSI